MKELFYLRHADKGEGENSQLIMEPGLALAAEKAPEGVSDYDDHPIDGGAFYRRPAHFFHGLMVRTAQTLLAAVTKHGFTGKPHPPIREMGDGDLFTKWVKELDVPFGKDGLTNLEAAKKGLGGKYKAACEVAATGVKKMFDLMEDGSVGLAYGHSPIIEMAMEALGFDTSKRFKLESLEGAFLKQDDKGNITVSVHRV